MLVMATFSSPFSVAVPPLPGATKTFCTRGLCASFDASACSRPPDPTTSSFISMPEVADAGKNHRHAALVGSTDDFRVAHAAAGLDHRRGAGVDHHVEAVTEREKRVRCRRRAGEREAGGLRLGRRDARA